MNLQQIRSDSLPAFAVTPHKNLKNYSKCESSRHIVDLSAQLVVLDRKAKVVKKVFFVNIDFFLLLFC